MTIYGISTIWDPEAAEGANIRETYVRELQNLDPTPINGDVIVIETVPFRVVSRMQAAAISGLYLIFEPYVSEFSGKRGDLVSELERIGFKPAISNIGKVLIDSAHNVVESFMADIGGE